MWKEADLLDVPCNCPVALQLTRYNVGHDEVLHVIYTLDQPVYIFPPHVARTDLRPDIVIWNDVTRSVVLFELILCHESFVDVTTENNLLLRP